MNFMVEWIFFTLLPKKGEDWMKKKIERIIDRIIFLL